MTLQTLVVLMIGAAYGRRLGAATMVAYLAEGAAGLAGVRRSGRRPRAAAGADGGISSVGFVVAAFLIGWLSERGWDRSVPRLFVAMAVAHVAIFVFGFVWLAFGLGLGADKAWLVGVTPFIAASVIKNALGAALVPALRGLADRQRLKRSI